MVVSKKSSGSKPAKANVVKMSEVRKSAQSVAASTSGGGGSKVDYMKLGPGVNKILILQPWNGRDLMKRLLMHQVWKGGKPIITATSPRIEDGGEDPIMDYGFRLREKYEDSPNKKKQELWRKYMPSDSIVVNALNLSEDNPTPKVLRLPPVAVKLLVDEIGEAEDGDEIWDLENGHPLIIKGNGKSGNNRRYEYAKFSKNKAALISEGRVDEDILNNLWDLDKLLPKIDESRLKKVLAELKKQDQQILGGGSEDEADDDDDNDEEEDEAPRSKKKSKASRSDDDDDEEEESDEVDAEEDDDDNDFEDDDDEPKSKKKPVKKSKASRDDDDEEDDEEEDSADDEEEDEELEEQNFDDDDEEDEEEVKPKKKALAKKAASVKTKSGLRKK